jgi:uncharacterized protein (DUF1697 family)
MSVVVALLRAINVGGRRLSSTDLRAVATGLGHAQVVTYLASGNLVLVADDGPDEVGAALSAALGDRTGFEVPVLTRDLAGWDAAVGALPFPDRAAQDPTRLALVCFDGPVGPVRTDLSRYGPESVAWSGREAYVWYPDGQGRSRLTLDVLSRAAGRLGTARNWRTVLALQSLAHERA